MKNNHLSQSEFVILDLIENINLDSVFKEKLLATLRNAKYIAQNKLNPELFEALTWPIDIEEYVDYLRVYSSWIPQQSKNEVWNNPNTHEHQEVIDRLNHFYWLIQQPCEPNRQTILERYPWFNKWLVAYAKSWGSFLNTSESFNQEIADSFIKYSPKYRVEDSMINGKPNNPSGWLSFNQFFARQLNPGLRPIANPSDNAVVTSPADCTYRSHYNIDADSTIPEVTMKLTHKFATIQKLLKGSAYKDAFAGGTFVHYFLGTYSYHRFHAPVSGVIKECYPIQGLVSLDVNIKGDRFNAPDCATNGYEFNQARGVIIIDTTKSPYGNMGIVAVIPIGMAQVSSVNMTATIGSTLLKGDEFGYFLFGGSDIIVLFQEGTRPDIITNNTYRLYGTVIANCKKL